MHIGASDGYAVLEDFTRHDGHIMWLGTTGRAQDLGKSLEPTAANPARLLLGHTADEVRASPTDLLGDEFLARPGDPDYAQVAEVFAPIRKISSGTYSFVGTPLSVDKVGFTYGGRSPNFDPATYQPSIAAVVKAGEVWNGLVGGYLPVLRFVYPEAEGTFTEMLAFAPLRIANGNDRVQPVWYRVTRVENGVLKWSRYVDTYQPFPPRAADDPAVVAGFYRDLMRFKGAWNEILGESMQIDLPDERVANMARFGLVRAILTRAGDFPKYGAVDKDYAGSEHDGFPDTFNVETGAMLEWGMTTRAARYIDNYFSQFVRDDGSLLYRGPEIGQFGRMLTVLAQYADRGGDPALLLRLRPRIDRHHRTAAAGGARRRSNCRRTILHTGSSRAGARPTPRSNPIRRATCSRISRTAPRPRAVFTTWARCGSASEYRAAIKRSPTMVCASWPKARHSRSRSPRHSRNRCLR